MIRSNALLHRQQLIPGCATPAHQIRGVDHPESIGVGPKGEAYTTGTGGQVYRLNLETNTAEIFASTTPRRMLGQAVDADGNLYCAEINLTFSV